MMSNKLESSNGRTGYSAKDMQKPVYFYCSAPKAQTVCLTGEFNQWDPNSLQMERRVDGWWHLQVPLTHGHHEYAFLVDGKPMLDPHAMGTTRNARGIQVSIIAVS
jgi:1,4-alpha-glucan branching enzyme